MTEAGRRQAVAIAVLTIGAIAVPTTDVIAVPSDAARTRRRSHTLRRARRVEAGRPALLATTDPLTTTDTLTAVVAIEIEIDIEIRRAVVRAAQEEIETIATPATTDTGAAAAETDAAADRQTEPEGVDARMTRPGGFARQQAGLRPRRTGSDLPSGEAGQSRQDGSSPAVLTVAASLPNVVEAIARRRS